MIPGLREISAHLDQLEAVRDQTNGTPTRQLQAVPLAFARHRPASAQPTVRAASVIDESVEISNRAICCTRM